MDLTRPISFWDSSFTVETVLNTVTLVDGVATGCTVDSAKFDIEVNQYLDPKNAVSGLDAGELSLGIATLTLTGTLYGATKSALYAALEALRVAFMPSQSEGEVDYSQPSASGLKSMFVGATPQVGGFTFERIQGYGTPARPLAIPWSCTFILRPPWAISNTRQGVGLTGSLTHAGDYASPIVLLLTVSGAGTIHCEFSNGQAMEVAVKTGDTNLFYDGRTHLMYATNGGVQRLAMDQIEFEDNQLHPIARPGTFAWVLVPTGTSVSQAIVQFDEAWAL